MISDNYEKSHCRADIKIISRDNLFLYKYDVEFFIDGVSRGTVIQGTVSTYSVELSKGRHRITFCREGAPSVKGSAELDVEDDLSITFSVILNTNKTIDKKSAQNPYIRVFA